MRGDRGAIVIGWVTKLILTLAVLGVLGFDTLSIFVAGYSAQDQADQASRLGAQEYSRGKDVDEAYAVASSYIRERGGTISPNEFTVDPATGTVTIVLHRTAKTLVFKHIGFMEKKTHMVRSSTGTPPR